MTSRSYFGKMNSTPGSVVPLAMFCNTCPEQVPKKNLPVGLLIHYNTRQQQCNQDPLTHNQNLGVATDQDSIDKMKRIYCIHVPMHELKNEKKSPVIIFDRLATSNGARLFALSPSTITNKELLLSHNPWLWLLHFVPCATTGLQDQHQSRRRDQTTSSSKEQK